MTAQDVLTAVFLGVTFGAIGQGARMIVGIKKTFDEANAQNKSLSEVFDVKQLLVSLIIGAIAGGLASLALINSENLAHLTKDSILALIGAGYSGADFIEGFMRNEETKANPDQAGAGTTQTSQQQKGIAPGDVAKLVPPITPTSDQR